MNDFGWQFYAVGLWMTIWSVLGPISFLMWTSLVHGWPFGPAWIKPNDPK